MAGVRPFWVVQRSTFGVQAGLAIVTVITAPRAAGGSVVPGALSPAGRRGADGTARGLRTGDQAAYARQMELVRDFPLFPLQLVALPSELIPLHIFEERYKAMIAHCLEDGSEFGIVWMGDDGLRPIGCACEVAEVLERFEDGRLNLVARGTRVFRIEERQDELPYPAGTVEFLDDTDEEVDGELLAEAHVAYASLYQQATDREPDREDIDRMGAYEMAATVEFGLDAKQGLLDLRSETARLKLLLRLFRSAAKRLEVLERAQTTAKSNGKLR